MSDINKKYIVAVGADKKSLDQLKKDLAAAVTQPFEENGAMQMSRADKAAVKKDVMELFGLIDEQAAAVGKMMAGIIPTDTKDIDAFTNGLKDMLEFATGIMETMQKMDDSTSWMRQGVSFVDKFVGMEKTLKGVSKDAKDLRVDIDQLTESFEGFRRALLATQPAAFTQRFGAEMRATTKDIQTAMDLVKKFKRVEHEGVSFALHDVTKDDLLEIDESLSVEDLRTYHKDIEDAIREHLQEMKNLESQYSGKALYDNETYRDHIRGLAVELKNFDNLTSHGLFDTAFADATVEASAKLKTATEEIEAAAQNAGTELKKLIDDFKNQNVEIEVVLPDASAAEFTAKIDSFVKQATAEFQKKPVSIDVDFTMTSPFKKDAFDEKAFKNGELQYKKLSKKQRDMSAETAKLFKEEAFKSEFEVNEENLEGLNQTNTNKIVRNTIDAFTKINKAMREGQALLTETTKKWRNKIEQDLTITPQFAIETAKKTLDDEMGKLQDQLSEPNSYLDVYADTDSLVNGIQKALNEAKFKINVEGSDIGGNGGQIIINATGVQLETSGPVIRNDNPPIDPPKQSTFGDTKTPPTPPSGPIKQQTASTEKNTTVIESGTRAQAVLTNAVNDLRTSIQTNNNRAKMAEQTMKDLQAEADGRAKQIADYEKSAVENAARRDAYGDKISQYKTEKANAVAQQNKVKETQNALHKRLFDLFKAGNEEQFNAEFQRIVNMFADAQTGIQKEIENVRNSKHSDDDKRRIISGYEDDLSVINKLLNGEVNPQDKLANGKRAFQAATSAVFNYLAQSWDELILSLDKKIEDDSRMALNADRASTYARGEAEKLKNTDKIAARAESAESKAESNTVLQSRLNKINAIIEGNQDPVNLVLNELDEFWAQYKKKMDEATAYVQKKQKEAGMDKLDPIKDADIIRDLDSKLKQEDEGYRKHSNTITNWTKKEAAMVASGLDIRGLVKEEALEVLQDVLENNSMLASSLSENSELKGLKNIKELAYFIPKVQEAYGISARTSEEYISDQELQANLKEALRVSQYIKMAKELLSDTGGDLDPTVLEQFIDYFGHIPGMAEAVEAARKYLDAVKNIPDELSNPEEPKTYVEQIDDIWQTLDKDVQGQFISALNATNSASNITSIGSYDATVHSIVESAFNERNSELAALQTSNPQLQQILNILERSKLLGATRDAANAYGDTGILSALFGMQKYKMAGNFRVPKDPIHVTTYDKNGKKRVASLGASASGATDGRFSYKPESLDKLFRFGNIEPEINEITKALFNKAIVIVEQLEHKIASLRSELAVLEGFNQGENESTDDYKKRLNKLSYRAFDGTGLEADWHKKKDLEAQSRAIYDILKANLEVDSFPEGLWKELKGLRKQKGLEKEIKNLQDGYYSDEVKKQLQGLSEKDASAKIREIISSKQAELESVKAVNANTLRTILAKKLKDLHAIEDEIVGKTQEVIQAKRAELTATKEQLDATKPLKAQAMSIVDALLNDLIASGRLTLSQGKAAETSPWDGKYKYKDSALAKYNEKKEANDKEIIRLQGELEKFKNGQYDEQTLANVRQEEEELVRNGAARRSDEELKQIAKDRVVKAIASHESTIEQLRKLAITQQEIIESLLALEDDIALDQAKADHALDVAKKEEKLSDGVSGRKKYDKYRSEKERQKSAAYAEASVAGQNVNISKTGRKEKNFVAKVDNILERIQFAKTHGLMDTTEIEKLIPEYERLMQVWEDTKVSKDMGNATEKDVANAADKLREARKALIDKFFDTDGWFVTQQLQDQYSRIEGELARKEEEIRSGAASTNGAIQAQKNAINEQGTKDKAAVDRYIDALRDEYIEKPREEIRKALNAEVDSIRAATKDKEAAKAAVFDRAYSGAELESERIKLAKELENDQAYIVLKQKKHDLMQIREELKNDSNYQELLLEYQELKDKKLLGTDRAKEVYRQIQLGYKHIDASGKNTQEFKDVEAELKAIEQSYTERFNAIRRKWIEDELARIDKIEIDNGAYSKNAIELKYAQDIRDADIARLPELSNTNKDVLDEQAKIRAEWAADQTYSALTTELDQLTKEGKQDTDRGKEIAQKLAVIDRKYNKKINDVREKWIISETERINKDYTDLYEKMVSGSLSRKETNADYMSSLTTRKKEVIDRLMNNAEFSRIVEDVKAENGIDALSADGKGDYNKLAKALIEHGIPDGLVSNADMMVLADEGVTSRQSLEKHLQTLQKVLDKKIEAIVANAINQVNDADIIPETDINAKVEAARTAVEIAKEAELAKVKGKTDRQLLEARHDDAAATEEGRAAGYLDEKKKKKELYDAEKKKHGIDDDMLKAAREGTILYREVASEGKKTAEAIGDANEAVEKTASGAMYPSGGSNNSVGYAIGGGAKTINLGSLLGGMDTSNLAREGTLRGIYELLNGGAPAGGWNDSISEVDKTHENQGSLSDNKALKNYQQFAASVYKLTKESGNLPSEVISLLGNQKVWSTATSGERGSINMKDVYDAFNKEKHVIKASMHNHPNGKGLMSKEDVRNFLKLAYDETIPEKQRAKVHGAYSDTDVSSINFNGISQAMAEEIINTTFSEFYDAVAKRGLTYNDEKQEYLRDGVSLDAKNVDDLAVMQELEDLFYDKLKANFVASGFNNAFQHVGVEDLDEWAQTIFETEKSILLRAAQLLQEGIEAATAQIPTADVNDATSKVADAITESASDAAVTAATTTIPEQPTPQVDTASSKTADAIVESAGEAAQIAAKTEAPAASQDISNVFAKIFERFKFSWMPKESFDEIQSFATELFKGQIKEGLLGNSLKITDDGRVSTVSDNVFSDVKVKKKIVDAIFESLDIAFANYNKHPYYELDDSDIKPFISENITGVKAESKKKSTRAKKEDVAETIPTSAVVSDKDVKNAKDVAAANKTTTKEKEKQNQLATDGAAQDQKAADTAEQRAKSEEKASAKKKEANAVDSGSTTSTSNDIWKPQSDKTSKGGIHGLAQESTLQKIHDILSKGIKVDTEGKVKDASDDKKGSEPTQEKKNLNIGEAEKILQAEIAKRYPINEDYPDTVKNSGSVRETMLGYSMDFTRPKNMEEIIKANEKIKALQAEIEQYIANGEEATNACRVAQENLAKETVRYNGLLKETEQITLTVSRTNATKFYETSAFKNLDFGIKAANKELATVETTKDLLRDSRIAIDDKGDFVSDNKKIQDYLKNLKKLQDFKATLKTEDLFNPANQQRLDELAFATQNARKEMTLYLDAVSRYNQGKHFDVYRGALDNNETIKTDLKNMLGASNQAIEKFGDLKKVTNKYGETVAYQLGYSLRISKKEVQEMTATINPLTREITLQEGALKTVSTGWEKFWQGLKGKAASIVQYIASITSIQDIIRYAREGVQYVREIDGALTELKKVTDETDESYRRFLQDMAKTGSVIGATVTDLTTMAAEWARLGYSMKEAGKLAESTAILLNVSEFDDATQASEALISTMQAFGYAADESGRVVDVLNEVGNNYAISSDGIATALQDSAAALMEGGNNLEQAVALVAAANRVVQDPNSVGSALRTISLRLRGTSVKVLEEMGEETDGVVESVSKMQSKIEALTGIDILTDSGAYKDTYTILYEIGQVWEDMSDIDQAALLELMAGKNRANTLAAILGNMEDLEGAYNDALNAEGSALKENEAYLDSIQGRIDLFTNALQTMWMNLIDSETIKTIVDLGTELIKLVDTIGVIPTLLGAFGIKEGITGLFGPLFKELTEGGSAFEYFTYFLTDSKFQMGELSVAAGSLKTGVANLANGLIGLGKGLISFFTTPIGIATAVIGAIAIISVAIDNLTISHEEYIEQLDKETEALQTVQSELKNVQSELETTKDRIDELQSKRTLSFVEQEELDRLKEQNAELERQEKILKAKEERARQKQIEMALNAANTDVNFKDNAVTQQEIEQLYTGSGIPYAAQLQYNRLTGNEASTITGNNFEIALQELENAKNDLQEAEKQLASGMYTIGTTEYTNIENNAEDAKLRIEQYNDLLDKYSDEWESKYGDTGYSENDADEWKEFYNQYHDYMDKQALINNTIGESDVLNRVFGYTGTDLAKEFKSSFEAEVKSERNPSEVIAELLNSEKYAPVLNDLQTKFGITADTIKAYFTQVGESGEDVKPPEFNIESYTAGIKTLTENIATYQGALESLESGTFTMTDFVALIEQFPELAKGVDVSSKSFNGLSKNLRKAIRHSPDDLVDDLKLLREQLQKTGKSTTYVDQLIESMENMPEDSIKSMVDEYVTLADKINDAAKAQNDLQEAMNKNPNEGYETRGEAMEYMKDKMSRGEIGSESELWDVAKEYGFTYDSSKAINENADALAKFIAIREKWFAKNDDGDYTFEGTEDFIKSVENAVNSMPELAEILDWNYDETTGGFGFDFDNENWDKIVSYLSQTEELSGLTSEEFKDMLVQIGQYFNVEWENISDISTYISDVATSSDDAATRIDKMTAAVESYIEKALGKNIDFDSLKEENIVALECDETIKTLLRDYLKLKEGIKKNPFSINVEGDIESDIINPLRNAGLKIDETIDELEQKQFTFDVIDLETLMRENGYDTESIVDVINGIFGSGSEQANLIACREAILNIEYASDEAKKSLDDLGVSYTWIEGSNGAVLTVTSNIDEILAAYQFTDKEIEAIKQKWADGGIQINTEANTEVIEESQDLLAKTPDNVVTHLLAEDDEFNRVMNTAEETLKDFCRARTATITVKTVTTEEPVQSEVPKSAAISGGAGGNGKLNQIMHATVNGTAHAQGSWGAENTGTSLVGELGPEILVRDGRWTTVGDNGAEFTQIKRGDIIFNHKQSEQLLKNGYVAGRGKLHGSNSAFASGTAFVDGGGTFARYEFSGEGGYNKYNVNDELVDTFGDLSDAVSDAEDTFREVFDWVEVRLEEIDETLGLLNSQLENAIGFVDKNNIINDIIGVNNTKLDNLEAGYKKYADYAAKLLTQIPEEYHDAVQNGAISIEEFVGEADEVTLEAIQNYREWAQKAADLKQQANEVLTEIQDLAKQAFDNIVTEFENKLSRNDSAIDQYEAHNDLLETDKGFAAESIYRSIMAENEAKQAILEQERAKLQAELDTGKIEKYSDAWYEAVNKISEVETEIVNLEVENKNLQDTINELKWSQFDLLIKQLQVVSDEAANLLEVLETKDAVDDFGNWTEEGITSLGLYAQQMENAEKQAAHYAEAIKDLEKGYAAGKYTLEEYTDKLDELKSGQYDAIKSYNDAKDAIVELNKTRVEAIKEGIEEEIDAYSDLIKKKKELLQAEKDEDDFKKSVADKEKNISDIRRKLAALEFDDSMSAVAKKKQLSAELAEAEYELQELYSDRSYDKEQEALDKELEDFEETKNKEIENWEKYLENVEHVVADSLAMVQENTSQVLATLQVLMTEFGLTISDAIKQPWKSGKNAIDDYGRKLGMSLSELAAVFGLTVDAFAAKLGLTTEAMVSNLDITVAQMAENLGLTNEQLAASLGLTVTDLNDMMGLTIQELASRIGLTVPSLAEKLGYTTDELVGKLDITMAQFAGSMGLTIDELADKFGITTTEMAKKLNFTYQELVNPFGALAGATVKELENLAKKYTDILASIEADSKMTIKDVQESIEQKEEPKKDPEKPSNNPPAPQPQPTSVGSKINAGNATIYADSYGGGGGKQYFASDPNYIVLDENNGYILVRHHSQRSGYTGWFKKSDLPKFASGTTGTKKSGLAWIDEMGLEEIVMHAGPNGRLQYLTKGSAVLPNDISENLMKLGQLDPSEVLNRNTPQIGMSPSVVNNTTEINLNIAEVVHIDHVDHDNLPDLTKAVRKEMDSYMTKVNNAIRSKVR